MKKNKIINDPVFGFIKLPEGLPFKVFGHRYVQRLTRIRQLGLSSFVYPGAQHTRFQHTIGAMFLMSEALRSLKEKGNEISPEEEEAAIIAIILHDIGHGPFSHALEGKIIEGTDHETVTLKMMEKINSEFDGRLDLAIKIFRNAYNKNFLHQLVSGNLDVDRLDYLRRDCFFTGVVEGNIGSARLIKMMNLKDGKLVVEAKGIYSIENFLLSRRLMYWQVYLHKTSFAAEKMLQKIIERAKYLIRKGVEMEATEPLSYFLHKRKNTGEITDKELDLFENLDDNDIWTAIKTWKNSKDKVLSILCKGLIERKLFKINLTSNPEKSVKICSDLKKIASFYSISEEDASYFISSSKISKNMYKASDDSIEILYKDNTVKPITNSSDILNNELLSKEVEKYAYCYIREPFGLH